VQRPRSGRPTREPPPRPTPAFRSIVARPTEPSIVLEQQRRAGAVPHALADPLQVACRSDASRVSYRRGTVMAVTEDAMLRRGHHGAWPSGARRFVAGPGNGTIVRAAVRPNLHRAYDSSRAHEMSWADRETQVEARIARRCASITSADLQGRVVAAGARSTSLSRDAVSAERTSAQSDTICRGARDGSRAVVTDSSWPLDDTSAPIHPLSWRLGASRWPHRRAAGLVAEMLLRHWRACDWIRGGLPAPRQERPLERRRV